MSLGFLLLTKRKIISALGSEVGKGIVKKAKINNLLQGLFCKKRILNFPVFACIGLHSNFSTTSSFYTKVESHCSSL